MDAIYNDKGEQMPDQTPVELPLGYHHPESIQDMISRMVRDATLQQNLENEGFETEEEANDFDDSDDDHAPPSNHEYTEMEEEHLKVRMAKEKEAKKEKEKPHVEEKIDPPKVEKIPEKEPVGAKTQ